MGAELTYGCRKALPEGIERAWGARLIAPDDLLWDRQSWLGDDERPLQEWLNGGALRAALAESRRLRLAGDDEAVYVLYDDERGVIKGSAQGSWGYIYLAAWLHEDVVAVVPPEPEPDAWRRVS